MLDAVVSGLQIPASLLPVPTEVERSEPLQTDDINQMRLL
jgi:hypothetical protein